MTDTNHDKPGATSFLSGGEMSRRIREFDWSKTSLGPISQWSEALKNTVSIALFNRFPMLIWWGKDYIQIYNDAYIPVLGLKHPDPGLGRPGWACWDEIWDILGPLVDTPFHGGPATWMDDILLKINRNNRIEETHFLIAYSPVPDPATESGIGGVLATVNEITDEIISKRQMETLRKLGKAIFATRSEDEVYAQVTTAFKENPFDVPFVMIHRLDADPSEAVLAATSGIEADHPVLKTVDRWKSFEKAVRERSIVVGDFDKDPTLPVGGWDQPPRSYLHVPVRAGKNKAPAAIITMALNPYRQYDDLYSNFIELVADQVAFGVSNALAFEVEQKRAEALAEIDKAKTIFFGNISHEFRTPLTLMLGPINDMLAKDSSSMLVAERDTLLLVQRNALRLQKLVNSLLDFSRIEAGKYKASFRPLDISRITADLASNFTSLMKQADLIYEVDCPILPEPAYIDPEMWEKIVLNLISNAFKFTIEGKISVKTRLVDKHFEMTVSDTGVGISKENLAHLFERFHRVENVKSRTHEGSGIGLALVNELVRMHGGKIAVESAEDEGTTFTVSIPVGNKHLPAEQLKQNKETFSPAAATKPQIFHEEASRWLTRDKSVTPEVVKAATDATPRVLLAEDNVDMQLYIKGILEEYCQVFVVSNGRQALERAKVLRPDLILSDIMMPEVDGLGLVKALRKDEILQTIPIILLSARAGEEARIEGLQSGADDYLIKPFGRNELIARVSSNLQLSKLRKEALQAVRYSEAQLRALVNATSDVIYRMSADWKIMQQLDGRNFLLDTGVPLENWEEKYIHPKDRARVWNAIQQAIKTRSMFQLEHQVIRSDGTLGWTLSRAIPIFDENGEIFEWFGAASDISGRKFYETELEARVEDRTKALNKANSELQVSNDDLQQFAHVASHDLKEPLRKIKTFTLRLQEEFDGAIPPNGKAYLEKVLSAVQRMSTMIDGVLTYSSLNAEGLGTETIDLNTIIRNIEADLELMIQQKRAKIVVANLPSVTAGRVLMHQLFYNLINNSLKFSHPDRAPLIEIRSRRERRADGDIEVISVSDNGIGFDQDQSERIFETFTRLHSKDRFDGTGLGLALCKKIVERYKGSIKAFGKKDVGATFVIELPALRG